MPLLYLLALPCFAIHVQPRLYVPALPFLAVLGLGWLAGLPPRWRRAAQALAGGVAIPGLGSSGRLGPAQSCTGSTSLRSRTRRRGSCGATRSRPRGSGRGSSARPATASCASFFF